MKKHCILLFFCCLNLLMNTAGAYNLKQVADKEYMSNSSITSLCQDDKGLMWIGTCDGLNIYDGQEIEFVISEFNPRRNRVIGDRRQLLVAERAEKQKELFARLQVGDRIDGIVKNVTDFGAFIDLGGVDGLLHISEMSWGRVENPKKAFQIGDTVTVLVKDINDTKVALSLKFPETNPWANSSEEFAVGTEITGRVARMTDFGAFIELAPGVDALLHVSQISRAHVEKPSDVLAIGQEVTAKIVDLNEADKKISLSMKALEPEVQEFDEEAGYEEYTE